MKVSLKEARRIERRIQEKGINKGYPLRAHINIYTETDASVDITKAEKNVEDGIFNAVSLINARSNVRRLIQETNETSGINALIAMREEYIRILSVWEGVSCVGEEIKPTAVVKRSVEVKLARAESGKEDYYSSRADAVEFTAVSEELHKISIEQVRVTQAKIDRCDDELAGLNALTKIEITNDIIELLQQNNII